MPDSEHSGWLEKFFQEPTHNPWDRFLLGVGFVFLAVLGIGAITTPRFSDWHLLLYPLFLITKSAAELLPNGWARLAGTLRLGALGIGVVFIVYVLQLRF